MNDVLEEALLAVMIEIEGNNLVNALANPMETRPVKAEKYSHDLVSPAWTHRFKKSGQPQAHKLFDQIWLSPKLAEGMGRVFIDRLTKHGGDGSDHDPAWVELEV